MRKRYKKKLRSCGLCKPHKKGWSNRWLNKELYLLKEFEKMKQGIIKIGTNWAKMG